jgi:CHAT domain-containing protein
MVQVINNHRVTDYLLLLVVLCCFALTSPLTAAQTNQDVPTLTPNNAVERELKGGETHTYQIHLSEGQFLDLIVDQLGIDVAVNLIGPDGNQVFAIDGPYGRYGPESVAVVAEKSGVYRLEVRSPNKSTPTGRYKVAVLHVREATSTDKERVAAEGAFAEAYMKLRPQRTPVARRAAIEKCRESLRFFQATGDEYRQAWIMLVITALHAEAGEFREAFDYANQTLPHFRTVRDRVGEGSTLSFLGGMSDVLGDPQKALWYYNQALLAARESNNQSIQASVLNSTGKIYNDLNDWQRAIDYYGQALALFREIGNQRLEAITLHNIGVAYSGLGEMDRALDFLQRALPLRRTVGDKAGEADTLTSIGYVYNVLGRSSEALEFYKQAMPLRLAVGDRRAEGITLDHIGIAYSSMGEPARALDYHQQALERHRAAGSVRTEAVSLANIGHVYDQLGQPQKAVEFYTQAHSLFTSVGDRQNQAKALEGSARAEIHLGNLQQAKQLIEEAIKLIEAVRSTAGAQLLRASYFASQQSAYELHVDLLMRLHRANPAQGYDAEALRASERRRARSLLEMLNEAHVDFRQGVKTELVARERDIAQSLNAKAQRLIQLTAQKGNREEIATLNKEVSTLEDEYQQLQAEIRKASPGYAALTQPQPLGLREIQAELDPNTLLLEYSLGNDRSYLWAISRDSCKTYELPKREEIQRVATLVYDSMTARSVVKSLETPAQRQTRIEQADLQFQKAAIELSQMVLSPVAAELRTNRLVVVADGALQYVPFAALPVVSGQRAQGRPLILNHEVISLPSASTLAVQRRSLDNRKPAPKAVAVIADPVFSTSDSRFKTDARVVHVKESGPGISVTNDTTRIIEHLADSTTGQLVIPRLPFTREEAEQILAVAPRGSNLKALDFRANRAAATNGELSRYRYVHFATHGYLDSTRADLSAIVLSLVDEEGKPQDGFLRTHDIYNLNFPAELVVLSACETGLGKDVKGEGLVGLTRGFMFAGARRVVVSLWNVNDKATASLMQRLYIGMLKGNKTPAASLRAAQMEMLKVKQWQSPYYWAAFVVQGEWR